MKRITFDQLAIHDRGRLNLLNIKMVDPVNGEGGRREVVVIVERKKKVVLIVLLDFFDVFGLLCTADNP